MSYLLLEDGLSRLLLEDGVSRLVLNEPLRMDFAGKIAYLGSNCLGYWKLADGSDIRGDGTPFPPRRNYNDLLAADVSVSPPSLPDANYPPAASLHEPGGMYRDSASDTCNVYKNVNDSWVLYDTESYQITFDRDDVHELNMITYKQSDKRVYGPIFDSSTYYRGSGLTTGSWKIYFPSGMDDRGGGYIDCSIAGWDRAVISRGPHNGGELYTQFMYKATGVLQTWGGSFTNNLLKISVSGAAPTNSMGYLGTSPACAHVCGYDTGGNVAQQGWGPERDGVVRGYSRRDLAPNGAGQESQIPDVDERDGYLQDAVQCPWDPDGDYPDPCFHLEENKWYEITERRKLQPVGSDFTISGTTLSRTTATFSSDLDERYVYIVGDGYYRISSVTNSTSVTLADAPTAGSGKTVYISGYPNSIFERWFNGRLLMSHNDQTFVWDYDGDTTPLGFGQIRLLNQMSGKTGGVAHTAGACWYQGLIFADAPIPMMGYFERKAAEMDEGSTELLNTAGDSSGYTESWFTQGGLSGDWSYTEKSAFDPDTLTVWNCAGEHDGQTVLFKYDIATNTWTNRGETIPPSFDEGTAQNGATSNTIILANTASTVDNTYNNRYIVRIVSGAGSGQWRICGSGPASPYYVGATRTLSIAPAWTTIPNSTSQYIIYRNFGHSYDAQAIVDGKLYVIGHVANPEFRIMDIATETWNYSPAQPALIYGEFSLEYFPDRIGGGELLLCSGGYIGGLSKYNGISGGIDSWSTIHPGGGSYNSLATTTINALQLRGACARYNPIGQCVYLFGGTNTDPAPPTPDIVGKALYKYDSSGNLSRLQDMPSSMVCMPRYSVKWVDPVSGDLLVYMVGWDGTQIETDGGGFTGVFEFWKFSWADLEWSQLSTSILPAPSAWLNETDKPDCIVPVPISTYGVTMLPSYALSNINGTTAVYLHKHDAAAVGTPEPPATIFKLALFRA